MKVIGGLLILVGLLGIAAGGMMFGDIGIAAMIAGVVGLLSGIGFWRVPKPVKQSIG